MSDYQVMNETYASFFGERPPARTTIAINASPRYLHDKYLMELIPGVFQAETRERLLAIVARLRRDERIDAVVLAGTELPLLLRAKSHNGVRFLDTTQIHVEPHSTGCWPDDYANRGDRRGSSRRLLRRPARASAD